MVDKMRNILLLSTSTVHGIPYFEYASELIKSFVKEYITFKQNNRFLYTRTLETKLRLDPNQVNILILFYKRLNPKNYKKKIFHIK